MAGGLGLYPSDFPVSKTLVGHVAWWQAPGQPQAVLAWEKAHLPRRFAPADVTSGIAGDPRSHWSGTFSLPPVPGVLNTRDLVVEVFSAGGRQQPALADSAPFVRRVLRVTGLRWQPGG